MSMAEILHLMEGVPREDLAASQAKLPELMRNDAAPTPPELLAAIDESLADPEDEGFTPEEMRLELKRWAPSI